MAYASSTALLVGLAAVVAAGAAVTQATFAALVPDMVRRPDLARAVALGQTATSAGTLVGPPVAGLLVGLYGVRVPLLLDGLSFLCVAVAGLLITTRRSGGAAPIRADAAPATPWAVRGDRLLLPMMAMIGLVVTVVSGVNVVDVFFVRGTLHASTTMYGILTALWTGSMAIGSWLIARRRTDDAGYALLMAGVLALCCAAIGIAGLMPQVAWLVPLFVAGGAANGALNSITAVLISRRVPAAVRGRAFSYLGAVANAGSLAGFAAGGVLVGLADPRAPRAATV
jgi:MFS family permease